MNREANGDWQARLVALIKKYSGPGHGDSGAGAPNRMEPAVSTTVGGTTAERDVVTLANATCGDSVTVFRDAGERGDEYEPIRIRVRGCSLCKASAALAEEVLSRLPPQAVPTVVPELCGTMIALIRGPSDQDCVLSVDVPADLESDLQALSVLRYVPARQRCGVLAWESLAEFLLRYA